MAERLYEGSYQRYYGEAPFRCFSFLAATAVFLLAMAFGIVMLMSQWHSVDPLRFASLVLLVLLAIFPWFQEILMRGKVRKLLQGYQGEDREALAKDAARLSINALMATYFVMAMAFMFLASALIR